MPWVLLAGAVRAGAVGAAPLVCSLSSMTQCPRSMALLWHSLQQAQLGWQQVLGHVELPLWIPACRASPAKLHLPEDV